MAQSRLSIIRPIAVAVVMAFTAEQAAFAAPALQTIMPTSLKPEVGFRLPESVAVVDDAYKAPGSNKLIVLIQDAHTNDSGQMNVAKALAEILPKENITTVFTEADSGDVSLGYIKPFFSQKVREEVGRQMVRKGELRGYDYANLIGAQDFTLWGVEDPALYKETLEVYKDITLKRDKVRAYVDRIQRTADVIKGDVFSDEVRELDSKRIQNAKGDLSLADYAELLLKEAGRIGLSTARYPHIKFLRRLRAIEKRVDFKKASAEEREAIKVIPQADRDELLAAHKNKSKAATEENGFYTLFAEKLKGHESNFPELAKYFEYLKETRKMNALGVVGEVKGLEEDLFMQLSKTQDEAVLWTFARNLETLQNLIALKVSPDEYNQIKTESALYDIKLIAGFLNRKIADADKHYENALTLESSYEAVWKDATDFYELTLKRDRVFFDQLTARMAKGGLDKAVLITGGYHTPNLKAMFKSAGMSYVSLLPQVLAETDSVRYERLLLAQLSDKNSGDTRIAVGSRPARQTAAMVKQNPEIMGARLSEAAGKPALQQAVTAARMSTRRNFLGTTTLATIEPVNILRPTGARMADYVLDTEKRQVLTSKMSMALISLSEVLQISGKNMSVQIDVDPSNPEGPTVVTFGDTSESHDFVPVQKPLLKFTPVVGAAKNFTVALPTAVPDFEVQVKDQANGRFIGILSVKAAPSVRTNVDPGSTGPFMYDIEIAFTPVTGIGARMAQLTDGQVEALELMADVQGWDPAVLKNVTNWYGSTAVSDAQRAVLDGLIDNGEHALIRGGFDAPTDYLRPGTAGTRGEMENLEEGKIGPNYFSATTVVQYVQAFIDWYAATGQTGPVMIAREVRDRSDEFADISMAMFTSANIPVINVSVPVSTPLASFMAKTSQVAFAFQISASHNNFKDNGIKFMGPQGQQLLPNDLKQITDRIPSLDSVREIPTETNDQLITLVDGGRYENARAAYFAAIQNTLPETFAADVLSGANQGVKFVYTALNGVGGKETIPFLNQLGLVEGEHYFTMEEEMTPLNELEGGSEADQFARGRKNSDPAGPGLLDSAMRLAESKNVRVIYAHDPDRDRMVVAVMLENGNWIKLSGNQSASLMLEHRLESGIMPQDSVIMRSHATTAAIDDIAEAHGMSSQKFPVGFKYPGAMITKMGAVGTNFFAAEESYGTSPGHIAEKDGLPAMAMVMWLAATHPNEPEIIWDYMLGIYEKYGVRGDVVLNSPIEGADAPTREANKGRVLANLDALEAGDMFGDFKIVSVSKSVAVDFLKDEYPNGFKDGYDLTVQDADGVAWRILLRASGTEPILKAYVSLVEPVKTTKSDAAETLRYVEKKIKDTVKPVIDKAFAEMAAQAPVQTSAAGVSYTGTIPFEANGQNLAAVEYDLQWADGNLKLAIYERSPEIGMSGDNTTTSASDMTVSTFAQEMSNVDFYADSFESVSRVEVVDSKTRAPKGLLVFTVKRTADGFDITAQLDPLDINEEIAAVERFSSPEFAEEMATLEQARVALSRLPAGNPEYQALIQNIDKVTQDKAEEKRQAVERLSAARESRARVFAKGRRVDDQVVKADQAIQLARAEEAPSTISPSTPAVAPVAGITVIRDLSASATGFESNLLQKVNELSAPGDVKYVLAVDADPAKIGQAITLSPLFTLRQPNRDESQVMLDRELFDRYAEMYASLDDELKEQFLWHLAKGLVNAALHVKKDTLKPGTDIPDELKEAAMNKKASYGGFLEISKMAYVWGMADLSTSREELLRNMLKNASPSNQKETNFINYQGAYRDPISGKSLWTEEAHRDFVDRLRAQYGSDRFAGLVAQDHAGIYLKKWVQENMWDRYAAFNGDEGALGEFVAQGSNAAVGIASSMFGGWDGAPESDAKLIGALYETVRRQFYIDSTFANAVSDPLMNTKIIEDDDMAMPTVGDGVNPGDVFTRPGANNYVAGYGTLDQFTQALYKNMILLGMTPEESEAVIAIAVQNAWILPMDAVNGREVTRINIGALLDESDTADPRVRLLVQRIYAAGWQGISAAGAGTRALKQLFAIADGADVREGFQGVAGLSKFGYEADREAPKGAMEITHDANGSESLLEFRLKLIASTNVRSEKLGNTAKDFQPLVLLTSHITHKGLVDHLSSNDLGYRSFVTVEELRSGRADSATTALLRERGVPVDDLENVMGDIIIAYNQNNRYAPVVYIDQLNTVRQLHGQTLAFSEDSNFGWPDAHDALSIRLKVNGLEGALDKNGKKMFAMSNVDNMAHAYDAQSVLLAMLTDQMVAQTPEKIPGQKGGALTKLKPEAVGRLRAKGLVTRELELAEGIQTKSGNVLGGLFNAAVYYDFSQDLAVARGVAKSPENMAFLMLLLSADRISNQILERDKQIPFNQPGTLMGSITNFEDATYVKVGKEGDGDETLFIQIKAENPANIIALRMIANELYEFAESEGYPGISEQTAIADLIEYVSAANDASRWNKFLDRPAVQSFVQGADREDVKQDPRKLMTYLVDESTIEVTKEGQENKVKVPAGMAYDKFEGKLKTMQDTLNESVRLAKLRIAEEASNLGPVGAQIVPSIEEVKTSQGARMAESNLERGLKLAGFENAETITLEEVLAQIKTNLDLEKQYNEYLYLAYKYFEIRKSASEEELAFQFDLGEGKIAMFAAHVQLKGASINVRGGTASQSVGTAAIQRAIPEEQQPDLNIQAKVMTEQKTSIDGMFEALAIQGISELPLGFKLSLKDVSEFKKDEDKEVFVKDLLVKFRAAAVRHKNLKLYISDAAGYSAGLFRKAVDDGLVVMLESGQTASDADQRFMIEVATQQKVDTGDARLLVQKSAKSGEAKGMDKVTDWAAVITAGVLSIVVSGWSSETGVQGAKDQMKDLRAGLDVSVGSGSMESIRKVIPGIDGSVNAAGYAKKFANGDFTANETVRVYIIPIGKWLQTMRMMVAQVAMAA